ncbi:MAG: helix-turn-helix domain-containing protein, partial [Steroidobacteraceae bacterium]
MNSQFALGLPTAPPSDTVIINARCTMRAEEDQRVIVVGGLPVYHYCAADAVAEAYAMVMLVDSGFAQQTEVARAFGKSERSIRRYQERYAQAGMAGLGRPGGWRRGRRRISGKRLRLIERLKRSGLSNRAIAQRLRVSEMAIRKLVGSSKGEEGEQLALMSVPQVPFIEPQLPIPSTSMTSRMSSESFVDPSRAANEIAPESAILEEDANGDEPVPMSLDADAGDRTFDRQLAHLGLLDDAAPIFRDGERLAGALGAAGRAVSGAQRGAAHRPQALRGDRPCLLRAAHDARDAVPD